MSSEFNREPKKIEFNRHGEKVSFTANESKSFKRMNKRNIAKRMQLVFSLYAPDELIDLSRKLNQGGLISTYIEEEESGSYSHIEGVPQLKITTFDLMISSMLAKACTGDPRAAKLLLEYAYGKPEQRLILTDETEESIPLDMAAKVRFLEEWAQSKQLREDKRNAS